MNLFYNFYHYVRFFFSKVDYIYLGLYLNIFLKFL